MVTLVLVIKAVYALLGVLYVLAGIGAMVLPLGWVSPSWAGDEAVPIYQAAAPDSYVNHLTQEFGTLAIAVGFVFLWQARRAEQRLHWLLTLYLMLDASIHWFGPQGLIGSPRRGVINSIPPLIMLTLGLLREWDARATAAAGQISPRPTHSGPVAAMEENGGRGPDRPQPPKV